MGLFHKKAGQNLLRKSRALERMDRFDKETKQDPRKIYSSNVSREVTPETLFKDDFATGAERGLWGILRHSKVTLLVLAVILFIVAMVLLLVL